MSESINVYSGTVRYYKGVWTKDESGNNYPKIDSSSKDSWVYEFENIVAKTIPQLVFLLGKEIQDKKGLDFPVFINWETDLQARIVGKIPSSSERFSKLFVQMEK